MEKVDVHVHVFERLSEEFPRQVSGLAPAERAEPAEQQLRAMDAAGIDKTVLIDMGGPEIAHHTYVTHCVKTWPDRFTATGLVDADTEDAPTRLRELVEVTGIEGIRLGDLGDPEATRAEELKVYGLFEVARQLGININVYGRAPQIGCIELLAEAFPQVNISLDHLGVLPSTGLVSDRWGRPRFDDEPLPPATYERVVGLARCANVYVKVSGEYAFSKEPWPYADMKPMVERIYRAYGAERMMWCTDAPWIFPEPGYDQLVQLLDHHLPGITAAEKAMIMGGTALKIWFKKR
ncbi:MAG: amidohydrolase family protein [Candidatus Latescibacteria bacterium]|nr:amidohydrolase family protein [Candidatus Latescibacterota bacterium]